MPPSSSTASRTSAVLPHVLLGGILFISGFCSLAYQVVWLREFRLLFGGATPAASAVLAVFMGGLGIGGAWLGSRVERSRHPGRFYALVEAGITVAAVISPLLLSLVQSLYLRTGGIESLGLPLATLLQIGMTAVVIGPSCFLMGGTLPAALKYAQSNEDSRRATTAMYYGLNVCGAVSGAFLATFVMLPNGGNLLTLLSAGFANAVIALVAWVFMRRVDDGAGQAVDLSAPEESDAAAETMHGTAPRWFIYAAAFTSGFVFFLIELVWYRASIPLFGGSVYNFGLILTVALAGIGVGSLLYSLFLKRFRPTLAGFALVSGLLAFFIILPFLLGDHLAYLALLLNNFFRPRTFGSLVFGWSIISGILVFLPAVFSGIQFPLMISLLGRGNHGIGREIGHTYAWNTLGAVSGALLGGFILIPAITVSNCWRLSAIAAVALSIGSLLLGLSRRRRGGGGKWPTGFSAAAGAGVLAIALFASGPSSYWYHHPIGYGRAPDFFGQSHLVWADYVRTVNRTTLAAIDGRESTVSLHSMSEYAIYTNGKSDSSAIADAPTTVMIGLTGAALHPTGARDVCVIGLATGVTVGWLTQVDGIESVDALELESATIGLSRFFQAVNFGAVDHPKTHFIQGDAREYLAVHSKKNYDLIISEPSNLHRAGVANLYTREFYTAVASRMNPEAIFCQWVQAYETDLESIHLVITTLRSVFPKVELWQTLGGDLLLVCSPADHPWDYDVIAARLQTQPFQKAARQLWGTTTPEGFIARAFGNQDFSTRIAAGATQVNTDDHNFLEFAFGRRVGASNIDVMGELRNAANENRETLPALRITNTRFDPEMWAAESIWKSVMVGQPVILPNHPAGQDWPESLRAQTDFLRRRGAMTPADQAAGWPVGTRTELSRVVRVGQMAKAAHPGFSLAVEEIRAGWPIDATIFEGYFAQESKGPLEAIDFYLKAIVMTAKDPWVRFGLPNEALQRVNSLLGTPSPELVAHYRRWFEIVASPLAFAGMTDSQRALMVTLANELPIEYKVRAAESWGEHFPWRENLLRFRAEVFKEAGHPQSAHATRELERFLVQSGLRVGDALPAKSPTADGP
jgi:predicted membrane-bound spermidine synthase